MRITRSFFLQLLYNAKKLRYNKLVHVRSNIHNVKSVFRYTAESKLTLRGTIVDIMCKNGTHITKYDNILLKSML